MEEEKRAQHVEEVEELEAYPHDQMEEEYREDEPAARETEEEFHERELSDMGREESRQHKPAAPMDKELVPLLERGSGRVPLLLADIRR
jgi:hypothetical protein